MLASFGIITQVLDLGFTTLFRVRAERLDLMGDFTRDEIELVD